MTMNLQFISTAAAGQPAAALAIKTFPSVSIDEALLRLLIGVFLICIAEIAFWRLGRASWWQKVLRYLGPGSFAIIGLVAVCQSVVVIGEEYGLAGVLP